MIKYRCRTSPSKSSSKVLRQLGNLSWLKITTYATSSPSSVYLWSTCQSVSQSKKQPAKNNTTPQLLLACSFMQVPAYRNLYEVDFFLWETRSAHYNFCLQKWTYFLLLDKQGIVLCTFIQEVSFLSRCLYV